MPVFVFVLACTASAQAQTRWGARVGVVDGESMIGGDVRMRLGGTHFYFNPSLEVSSVLFAINADLHYDFALTRDSAFWVGAGIGEIIPEDEDLGFAVRALAGVGVRHGGNIFYTQLAKSSTTSFGNEDFVTLAVGVRF